MQLLVDKMYNNSDPRIFQTFDVQIKVFFCNRTFITVLSIMIIIFFIRVPYIIVPNHFVPNKRFSSFIYLGIVEPAELGGSASLTFR